MYLLQNTQFVKKPLKMRICSRRRAIYKKKNPFNSAQPLIRATSYPTISACTKVSSHTLSEANKSSSSLREIVEGKRPFPFLDSGSRQNEVTHQTIPKRKKTETLATFNMVACALTSSLIILTHITHTGLQLS